MMPPFALDCTVCQLAQAAGMQVDRWERVEVTDLDALRAAGLVKEVPDYARIRKLIADGREIAGAALGPVEYRLRAPKLEGGAQ